MKLQHVAFRPFILLAAMASLPALAEDSPHALSGNLGIYSDYAFRGVSQTAGDPAIQGGRARTSRWAE